MADQDKGDDSAIAQSWSSFADPNKADSRTAEKGLKDAGQTEIADRAVAQRIRQAREATGLPQGQLAYRVGLSVEQLDRYERGIDRVRVQDLAAIAKACGMPLGAFFVEEEQDEFPTPSDGHSRISDELAMRLRGAVRNAAPGDGQSAGAQQGNVASINNRPGQAAASIAPAPPTPVQQPPIHQPGIQAAPSAMPPPPYGSAPSYPHPADPAPPYPAAPYPPSGPMPARREQLVQEAITAFSRIDDPSLRRSLVELLRQLC